MSDPAQSKGAHLRERIRTAPGLMRNIVVIIAIVIIGIAAGTYMGKQMRFIPPWQDRLVIWAEFANVPGAKPDAKHSVTIAGVDVGQITDWKVSPAGTALLQLDIEPGHEIFGNAHAVLRSVNPLNQMFVELAPGGPPARPLAGGDTIPVSQTERPIEPDEILNKLDERSQVALTALLRESDSALARAPEDLPPGVRAVDQFLAGIKPAVTAVQTRREKLRQLMGSLSEMVNAVGGNNERVTRLADSTEQALGVLAANDDDLRKTLEQMPGLNDELRHSLTATQNLTGQLDPTLDNLDRASDSLPKALDRFTDTSDELRKFADSAGPFVDRARGVVADLRPFVSDVDRALDDTLPITSRLDRDTAVFANYLDPLSAFIYNTSSLFSVRDARGPVIRGHAVVPADGPIPGANNGVAPAPDQAGGRNEQPADAPRLLGPLGGNR